MHNLFTFHRPSLSFAPHLTASALAAALALAGSAGLYAEDSEKELREAEVTKDEEIWTATVSGESVYSGDNMIEAIQAAVDGLTPDRDWKETVDIKDSGRVTDIGVNGDLIAVHLPSYTVLDFHENTIDVVGSRENAIVPVRAQDAQHIEVRNLKVTGNPRFGIFMKGCEDVVMADIHLSLGETDGTDQRGGAGIRTEGGDRPWSGHWNRNFVLDNIFVEDTRGHGVELWRTDGLEITTVSTRNTGYAGLLLNQTRNARIGLVEAYRANYGGGYAGFRTANDAGPNIEVDKVVAIKCGRGVFTVSGSHGITIHEVEIIGSTGHGMLIEDTEDFTVNGGSISDCGSEGVRITSRRLGQGPGSDHHPASNVTIQNLRISGCPWGIRETLPRTNNNHILNNDLRNNENCLEYQGEGTIAENNICE